jgi:NAD(P)-dependent dehydrogenase (short-subunit alcohol dehydrogenase family)
MKLHGKTAIVTGAGSGIGRAIAQAFAAEGARVAVVDVVPSDAEETVRLIGGAEAEETDPSDRRRAPAQAFIADVSHSTQVQQMIHAVVAACGGIDILCNNAGLDHPVQHTVDLSEETWDRVMAVNARGPFLCAKYALPVMLRAGGGAIVNVASDLGYLAVPGLGAYCMSKGALVQLTRVLAAEYSKHNVRVNAICPTMVDTPMSRRTVASQPDPAGWLREVERSIPLGRIGQPDEIARAAVFLASQDASFVTGSIFAVDGGRSAI